MTKQLKKPMSDMEKKYLKLQLSELIDKVSVKYRLNEISSLPRFGVDQILSLFFLMISIINVIVFFNDRSSYMHIVIAVVTLFLSIACLKIFIKLREIGIRSHFNKLKFNINKFIDEIGINQTNDLEALEKILKSLNTFKGKVNLSLFQFSSPMEEFLQYDEKHSCHRFLKAYWEDKDFKFVESNGDFYLFLFKSEVFYFIRHIQFILISKEIMSKIKHAKLNSLVV